MATKLCMRIPELVRQVCEHLDAKSSYAMALTCRAFLEPALDNLWKSVDVVKPLAACLPEDLWHRGQVNVDWNGVGVTQLYLSRIRALTSEDLQRYKQRYAHRIKVARAPYCADSKPLIFTPEVYQALHLATDGEWGALTPALKRLEWFPPNDLDMFQNAETVAPFMSLFLAPTVTSFAIGLFEGYPLNEAAIFCATRRLAENLQVLDIAQTPTEDYSITRYLSSFEWPSLTHLAIPLPQPTVIPILASMPSLKELAVFIHCTLAPRYEPGHPVPEEIRNEVAFPALKELVVQTWGPCTEHTLGLLQYIPPGNNVRVVHCTSCRSSVEGIEKLVGVLTAHLNPEVLDSLAVHDTPYTHDVPEGQQERYDKSDDLPWRGETDIRPLFVFGKLERLLFNVAGGVRIAGPGDLERVSTAWPRLRELDVRPTLAPTQTPYLDHTHVLEFLRTSPSIRTFGVPFDATRVRGTESPPPSASPGVQSSIKLEVLRTWGSPIASSPRVAALCSALFPRLRRVEARRPWYYGHVEPMRDERRWLGVACQLWEDQYAGMVQGPYLGPDSENYPFGTVYGPGHSQVQPILYADFTDEEEAGEAQDNEEEEEEEEEEEDEQEQEDTGLMANYFTTSDANDSDLDLADEDEEGW